MAYEYKKTNYLFNPRSATPFKLSRTKIELFLDCPRCFYMDRRLGVSRPSFPSFTLNNAVDTLLKKEFDIHRANGQPHPLMEKYHIDAVPIAHEKLSQWRENFVGVQHLHAPTNLLIFGAIDDLWQDKSSNYIVVDYKATSTEKEISLEDQWKQAYKRQMEFYQWLLRQNNLKVSSTGYFVFCNGLTDKQAFDGKLEFHLQIIPYAGNDAWVEKAVTEAHQCLISDKIPESSPDCEYCRYIKASHESDQTPPPKEIKYKKIPIFKSE